MKTKTCSEMRRILAEEATFMLPMLGYELTMRRLSAVYNLSPRTVETYLSRAGLTNKRRITAHAA